MAADLILMTGKLPSASALGPVLATLTVLGSAPVAIWALTMLLLSLMGSMEFQFAGGLGPSGLLVMTVLGILAFRRAIAVLRGIPGWEGKSSRAVRGMLLVGVVAITQLPLTLSRDQFYLPLLTGPLMMIILGGLATVLGGAVLTMAGRGETNPGA